ncbi:3-beta hydroxysteroid dehydrogenase [Marmoricola endophyticus]|uniref:3-beta hydroxysteroid dehydrogenase n=1 Tax=Marmoricola endophyticus TaxID=2040280 RepID=A0A917BMV7_9ACTN|nr:NAD-dependent epimerase/dehydratase family protein [Marmoricola endophyticus]GGF51083.1 3-beta hydroxysteroid dehydrogenase [Marmoricola endophyticus]
MDVFVTGGTGLIGTAVVAELRAHGHRVSALARSDASARALEGAGASVVRGALGDAEVVRGAAAAAEGVVHLAFNHDFGTQAAVDAAAADEATALHAMGEALLGSGRPFVVASGTPWIAGRASTEDDPTPVDGAVAARGRAVQTVLALADRGVRSAAVRLPRTVHRDGRGGFAGVLTEAARRSGVAGYPGDGTQRWPAVHALDAAALFRLVLEQAPAGTAWHAVGEEAVAVRDTMEVVGRRLGLPVRSVPEETFGPLGPVFAMDQPSTSVRTRQVLGWEPTHEGLLADLERVRPEG